VEAERERNHLRLQACERERFCTDIPRVRQFSMAAINVVSKSTLNSRGMVVEEESKAMVTTIN
jgi:hypothetical protein